VLSSEREVVVKGKLIDEMNRNATLDSSRE